MAENLFEKYGIKEVADVCLYRIDRKDETYESQRKISISSILKSALTRSMVYPLDEDGKGDTDGFEAYIFKNADVLSHFNYDCDDEIIVRGSAIFVDTDQIAGDAEFEKGAAIEGATKDAIVEYLIADTAEHGATADNGVVNLFEADNCTIISLTDVSSNANVLNKLGNWIISGYKTTNITADSIKDIIADGMVKEVNGVYNTTEFVTYKSYFVAPVTYDLITIDKIIEFVGDNGYLVNGDGEPLTGADTVIGSGSYITFTAPRDADPDTIRARFAQIQEGLYESIGVIVRLTQPVAAGTAETEDTFTGTITVNLVDTINDKSGAINFTFTNAKIIDSGVKAILAGLSEEAITNLTTAQITTLIGEANTNANVSVAYTGDVTADNYTVFSVASTIFAEDRGYNKFMVQFIATLSSSEEIETGRYDLSEGPDAGHYHMDEDKEIGTHEFSYAQQVCMLYAKNQDLITKAGTRYEFNNADGLFANFEFDDKFAPAPNSKERVVVVGLSGRTSENLYDIQEIDAAIKELTDTIEAKAYDITYTDYAELVVEDEMGYYLPQQLGYAFDKKTKTVSFFDSSFTYADWAKARRGIDLGIYNAVNTWGDNQHYSINDAIDALKQEQKIVDAGSDITDAGFSRVFGGYRVTGKSSQSQTPLDDEGRGLQYEDYTINGQIVYDLINGKKLSSSYTLDGVLAALSTADLRGQVGQIRITSTAQMESNRAIYIDPDSGILSNSANIYLLKNVNGRSLASDKVGVFEFYDKKGNRLYYQDKVFAGTAFLALVVIGTMGLIFVVNRHCTKNVVKTAWMINDGGYITDKQAERIVKNGLIHTVTITECDESFDATCTVGGIKVRKTKKNVIHYTPVLYLDSLKVSTLEQASETTSAQGGRGNAKLITWDYGKTITLSIEDALYTPASMAAIWAGEDGSLKNSVKDTKVIDRMEKITANRSFIVPGGNQDGFPSEGDMTATTIYVDPTTMEPYQDGTPIAEGEVVLKFTRSIAYDGDSLGNTIEISADGFPGTYRVVGETYTRNKTTGKDQRFQFIIPEAKMSAGSTSITLEAGGEPVVFSFTMDVLRPDNGVMMKFVQFDAEENEEENDGSTMVKDTENLNLLDDAEMYKVGGEGEEELIIGATEY